MKRGCLLWAVILLITGCSAPVAAPAETPETVAAPGAGMGMGMGRQGGMMARHSAPIPAAYAGLTNPAPADAASLERGGTLYTTYCATCHGDGGMGDGPAGAALDPAPAPIAHTSQMLGDDYLYWRLSEGGAMEPFGSAMPAWSGTLDESERWDVINYVQALGRGDVAPRPAMGGAAADPAAAATREAEMLDTAVAQEVLTADEAALFTAVHAALEGLMAQGRADMRGNMASMQAAMLAELVQAGAITQDQAAAFADIHDRLLAAGLMQ